MNVIFYEKEDGTSPAAEFIRSLDKPMYTKTLHTLELLQEYGYMLRAPYSKDLGNGIMELWYCQGSTDKFSRAILTHLFCPHCVGKSST